MLVRRLGNVLRKDRRKRYSDVALPLRKVDSTIRKDVYRYARPPGCGCVDVRLNFVNEDNVGHPRELCVIVGNQVWPVSLPVWIHETRVNPPLS